MGERHVHGRKRQRRKPRDLARDPGKGILENTQRMVVAADAKVMFDFKRLAPMMTVKPVGNLIRRAEKPSGPGRDK